MSVGVQRRETCGGLEGGGAGGEVAGRVEGLAEADGGHGLGGIERDRDTEMGNGLVEAMLCETEQRHAEVGFWNKSIAVESLPECRFGLSLMTLTVEQIAQHEP